MLDRRNGRLVAPVNFSALTRGSSGDRRIIGFQPLLDGVRVLFERFFKGLCGVNPQRSR